MPAPFTLPTYQITPQACPNNNVNLDVTVFGQSDGGTVTGSPTICDGQSTGNMVLSGHRGDVIRWERSFNAGAFGNGRDRRVHNLLRKFLQMELEPINTGFRFKIKRVALVQLLQLL